jgi:hypothetical protein
MIAILSVAVLAEFSMFGPFWALATPTISGNSAAEIAAINSVGSLGGFVGPWVIGLVRTSTGGFRGGLLFAAGHGTEWRPPHCWLRIAGAPRQLPERFGSSVSNQPAVS